MSRYNSLLKNENKKNFIILKDNLNTKFNDILNNNKIKEIDSLYDDQRHDNNNLAIDLIESRDLIKETMSKTSEIRILNVINSTLDQINNLLKDLEKNINIHQPEVKLLIDKIKYLHTSISDYSDIKEKFQNLTESSLQETITHAHEKINNFNTLISISQNALTENIYSSTVRKHRNSEYFNKFFFFLFLIFFVFCTAFTLFFKHKIFLWFDIPKEQFNNYVIEYWFLKGTLILVSATLITYFLKQATHHQKLADQAYQTQIELQAFPSYTSTIPSEEIAIIRKELALKYFGREIDGTTQKDMSSLISDQMKNTTELVKATTDAIKNLKTPN